MSYAQNSFFCSLCLTFWHWLKGAWEESLLGHWMARFCAWLSRKWEGSFLVHLFYDEGRLSRAWGSSVTCRCLEWVLNLPLRFLRWLYRLLEKPLEAPPAPAPSKAKRTAKTTRTQTGKKASGKSARRASKNK